VTPPAPGSVLAPPISTPPVVVGAVPGLALAVIGGGVRMPPVQLAAAQPLPETAVEERPINRAGSTPGKNAFLPSKPAPRPVVPVHPRKQARH
jgi:hypothetical protein